jgi:putative transposase
MNKAYQFRIYPTKKQELKLIKTLDTCRHLYNDALAERKRQAELYYLYKSFELNFWGKPQWIQYEDQANNLSSSKTPTQKEVYSQVLQNTLKRLDRSFKNVLIGFGYPRFKSRNRYNSFTYPQSGFELFVKDEKLSLSKIGNLKIILHRDIEGIIKTCTIKKDVDRWYASFSVEIKKTIEKIPIQTKTGVDVGLISLLTLSNGQTIEPPKFLQASEKRLKREQIKLSDKKLKSNNRNKQRLKVAKVHRRIRNQRKDFNQKESRKLVDTYDLIKFEDLQIQNMVRNHHLAKSIMDAGWGQIIRFTAYKAEYAGKTVELVDPYGTSQTCLCGAKVPKTLKTRIHNCPKCGLILNRDHVSAILIENKSTVGTTGIEACPSILNIEGEPMTQEATLLVGW